MTQENRIAELLNIPEEKTEDFLQVFHFYASVFSNENSSKEELIYFLTYFSNNNNETDTKKKLLSNEIFKDEVDIENILNKSNVELNKAKHIVENIYNESQITIIKKMLASFSDYDYTPPKSKQNISIGLHAASQRGYEKPLSKTDFNHRGMFDDKRI